MVEDIYNKIAALEKLNKKIASNEYQYQFLQKIKTTNFRNFAKDSEIVIKSPITAIVGKNGTGKTTLLHLAGCSYASDSKGKSFNQFIPESQKDHMPDDSRYGFTYVNNIENENNFVWYEKRHEWDRRGKNNRARRELLFIGFSKTIANVSVFKNYFDITDKALNVRLNSIGTNTISLDNKIISKISEIVGKNYSSIERRNDQYSLLCENCYGYIIDGQYSDFACGAGEISIIRMLDLIYNAPSNTLIIIDEPEVAIHPSVQYKLLKIFMELALSKNMQFIFTTHSYFILKYLNPDSILLLKNNNDNKIISQNVNSSVAFQNISEQNIYKLEAFVEDSIAADILNTIFKNDVSIRDQIKITKAISDGWVSFIQREMPLRFYNWKLYEQKDLRPVLVLDGDVRDKIKIDELKNKYGNSSILKRDIDSLGLDKVLRQIGKYFGLNSNKNIHFKSSFYKHREDSKFADIISEYIGHLSIYNLFLPGNLSPESEMYNWIKQKIEEDDINDLKIFIKPDETDLLANLFANNLPRTKSSEYSKEQLFKLKQMTTYPDTFMQNLIQLYVRDKRNEAQINSIMESFKNILNSI